MAYTIDVKQRRSSKPSCNITSSFYVHLNAYEGFTETKQHSVNKCCMNEWPNKGTQITSCWLKKVADVAFENTEK